MSKGVSVKPTNLPSAEMGGWGSDVAVGQDVMLAKILVMQPSSDMVTDGKAQIGEFRDSLSGVKLGSIVEPLEFIPIHTTKSWDILEEEGGQYAWKKTIPCVENPSAQGYNDNLPWEDVVNGVKTKNVRRLDFFVMNPKEIEAGTSIPYVISFRSTGFTEGKKVLNQMYLRNKRAGLPPAAYSFQLSGSKEKNDKGTFIVPKVELGRAVTQAELQECFSWYKEIVKGAVKVDEESEAREANKQASTQGQDTGEY